MGEWFKGVYRRQLTDMHISDSDDAFLAQFNEDEDSIDTEEDY